MDFIECFGSFPSYLEFYNCSRLIMCRCVQDGVLDREMFTTAAAAREMDKDMKTKLLHRTYNNNHGRLHSVFAAAAGARGVAATRKKTTKATPAAAAAAEIPEVDNHVTKLKGVWTPYEPAVPDASTLVDPADPEGNLRIKLSLLLCPALSLPCND
jgi:hypothetical protein